MANRWYAKGAQKALEGAVNWSSDTIKVALVTSAYTPNTATHEFLSSVSGVVGTAQTLAGKSVTDGVFDASDSTFSAVAGGSTVTQMLVYKDTGVAATSPLLLLFDTASGSPGLPLTTNGGDITVTWDNGTPRIVKIG